MNKIYLSGYLLYESFFPESAWTFLFLFAMCLVSINHTFHLLNYYLLTKVHTLIHMHYQSSKEYLKIPKSVLLYTFHLAWFEIIGQAQKCIRQFHCMVIVGNRGIWFGTIFPYKVNGGKWKYPFGAIFPYMVMVGNKGIWFGAIIKYCRCCFLTWACSLPFFYLINPMCVACMRDFSCIWSQRNFKSSIPQLHKNSCCYFSL